MINGRIAHDLALAGREKRFAGRTRGQMHDIIGANVVQEGSGVGAGELDCSLVRDIEKSGA